MGGTLVVWAELVYEYNTCRLIEIFQKVAPLLIRTSKFRGLYNLHLQPQHVTQLHRLPIEHKEIQFRCWSYQSITRMVDAEAYVVTADYLQKRLLGDESSVWSFPSFEHVVRRPTNHPMTSGLLHDWDCVGENQRIISKLFSASG